MENSFILRLKIRMSNFFKYGKMRNNIKTKKKHMINCVIKADLNVLLLTSNQNRLNSTVERQGLTNVIIKACNIPVFLFFCLY